ncbi:MAG: Co2+/Mg2+ efflux protein ApaG, partial [Myxococcales bacterium]|nr:Co2+/Mg2+ efflux protein ApaG [Myxococcales bacterium]
MTALATSSSAETRGVLVEVQSYYLEEQSHPASRRFVFAYTITITNNGNEVVQLRSRRWIITDGLGDLEEVEGPGVVGEQPVLRYGESFRYTSGAILTTERGTMKGTYQ